MNNNEFSINIEDLKYKLRKQIIQHMEHYGEKPELIMLSKYYALALYNTNLNHIEEDFMTKNNILVDRLEIKTFESIKVLTTIRDNIIQLY